LLHAIVNKISTLLVLLHSQSESTAVCLRGEKAQRTNKPSRTHCGDNIRHLTDGNGDRKFVSILVVHCGLFSLSSHACASNWHRKTLPRIPLSSYSRIPTSIIPMESTDCEFQIGCDSHKLHTNYASKILFSLVNLSFLSSYPSRFNV